MSLPLALVRCLANLRPPAGTGPWPRRLFYGWAMVPVAMLGTICTSPGQTYVVSVFNDSFRESLGLSLSQLTGAYMFGTLLAAVPVTFVGALMDRYGLRRTMTGVVLLFGAVCLLTAQVSSLATLFLAFFGLRLLGQGALTLLSTTTLAFWFDRRLGTVAGLSSLGMAGAMAVLPRMTIGLIDAYGWRSTYQLFGLTVWGIMLPLLVLVFRNRPEDVGQLPDGDQPTGARKRLGDESDLTLPQALRTLPYWTMLLLVAVWAMVATAQLFNVVPLLESRGLPKESAGLFYTRLAIMLATAQVAGGVLADRLPVKLLLAGSAAGLAASSAALLWAPPAVVVTLLAATMGTSQGFMTSSRDPFFVRYFGRRHLGKLRGLLSTVMVAASSAGPFLVGLGADFLGGFQAVLLLFLVLPLPLVACALALPAPPRRNLPESEIA